MGCSDSPREGGGSRSTPSVFSSRFSVAKGGGSTGPVHILTYNLSHNETKRSIFSLLPIVSATCSCRKVMSSCPFSRSCSSSNFVNCDSFSGAPPKNRPVSKDGKAEKRKQSKRTRRAARASLQERGTRNELSSPNQHPTYVTKALGTSFPASLARRRRCAVLHCRVATVPPS